MEVQMTKIIIFNIVMIVIVLHINLVHATDRKIIFTGEISYGTLTSAIAEKDETLHFVTHSQDGRKIFSKCVQDDLCRVTVIIDDKGGYKFIKKLLKVEKIDSQAFPQPTWAPSFNCVKASTKAERLICSNKELSESDVKLYQIYINALKASFDKETFRKEQSNWRKNERDVCADIDCMLKAYNNRIKQLSQ